MLHCNQALALIQDVLLLGGGAIFLE